MTIQSHSGRLSSGRGPVHALCAAGFIATVLLLAALEKIGVADKVIAYLFAFITLGVYAAVAILSRTMKVSEYFVAGRQVPDLYNGMAAGSGLSGVAFISLAGAFFVTGYDALAFALGWAGGFVLAAVLVAPYLRKFGAFSVPDLLAARFGGNLTRLLGVIVLMCSSFAFLVALITAAGMILSWFLGLAFETALLISLAAMLVNALLGGMRSATWTQAAQYIVLTVAFLIPAIWMSTSITGIPVPQLTYGWALQMISDLEADMVANNLADAAGLISPFEPFATYDRFNFFALIFCLMLGTASLPHVLMRYFTTPSVRAARTSAGWSLVFLVALVATAPAYAAFAKLETMQSVIGLSAGELAEKAGWIFRWGAIEGHSLVSMCGEQARSPDTVIRACGGSNHIVALADLTLHKDMIVLATPEIAGMPFVVSGLVAAGGLAAALATANSLLLAIANALGHDVYYKMIDRRAPASRRLVVARFFLLVVSLGAAYLASARPADLLTVAAWACSLAAAGLFPALVLGIWWKRCTSAGAAVGIVAGLSVTLAYLIGSVYGFDLIIGSGDELVWGIPGLTSEVLSINAGIFGIPAGFAVMIVVSFLTPEPPPATQKLVDDIRKPAGGTILQNGDFSG